MARKKNRKRGLNFLCKNDRKNGTRIYIKNKWPKKHNLPIYSAHNPRNFYGNAVPRYAAIRKVRGRKR